MRMRLKRVLKNNVGFSIIELMVAVAILAVISSVAMVSLYSVNQSNTKKSTASINSSLLLCKEKALTNAAKEWKTVVYEDKVEVVKVAFDDSVMTVASYDFPNNVKIFVNNTENGSNGELGEDYESVSFVFNTQGSVSKVYDNNGNSLKSSLGSYCYISSRYKSRKIKNVKLFFSTGKHIAER